MLKKSSIRKLSDEQRQFIERLMREDNRTLDEMLEAIKKQFPDQKTPSRSSLGRYRQSFDEMASKMREIQVASQVLVSEFGEDVDDKAGALLSQAVTTLATGVALRSNDDDKISIQDVGDLARAARAVMQTRTMSIKERQAIRKAYAEEAANAVSEELRGQDGMSEELEERIRAILLGKA
ncbi:phage protein Gp27 family protein [Agitococcus lubricus]|uniref:Uncharacterized protein DUF3486 n=1 Tax=Agitococcus lubricus TaxID=1077255 RepID=A0A2T5J3S3_9GAMM|nr:phage protein Gp27 family protein [Agitococcus lubricus]PTQ91260.1 uncharacterized protein DUF3486 [Agitococcus lubricus]